MNFSDLVAALSGILAFIAALATLAALIGKKREATRDLNSLSRGTVGDAIQEPDLKRLGDDLVDLLGGTSLRSYARNKAVHDKFDQTFNRIRTFLGPPDTPTETEATGEGERAPVPAAMWAELALARRDLEIALRKVLDKRDDSFESNSRMIRRAAERGFLDANVEQRLLEAVKVANAAIHGRDVPDGSAQDAVGTIRNAIHDVLEPAADPATRGEVR